jgi:membrane-associated phospholipid phosphatase
MCLIIGFRNSGDHTYNAFYKFALLWAALVSASRIFVGKHFLGDVLVGTAVGITVGYFTGMLARYVIQRYIDKVPPTGLTFVFDKKVSISPSRS